MSLYLLVKYFGQSLVLIYMIHFEYPKINFRLKVYIM